MDFTWDEAKNRKNLAKHGFDFMTAVHVFDDPYFVTEQDREVDGEARWQTIGMVVGTDMVLVAHTDYEDEGLIEIPSARKAKPHERKKYEKGV